MVIPDYRCYRNSYIITHSGVGHDDSPPGRGSGRYPYGSGERPFQDKEAAKAERREKRKENLKKAGEFVRKAAWTGIGVSLKVLASTAITSATLTGIGMAGFQFLQSPQAQALINKVGILAGHFLYNNFVAPAAQSAISDLDVAAINGMNYLNKIDPGFVKIEVDSELLKAMGG